MASHLFNSKNLSESLKDVTNWHAINIAHTRTAVLDLPSKQWTISMCFGSALRKCRELLTVSRTKTKGVTVEVLHPAFTTCPVGNFNGPLYLLSDKLTIIYWNRTYGNTINQAVN